jgi:hypothetical protein
MNSLQSNLTANTKTPFFLNGVTLLSNYEFFIVKFDHFNDLYSVNPLVEENI